MKKIVISAALLLAQQAYSQWTLSYINTYENHNNVVVVDNKTGFMDGYGKLLKTTDGGKSWSTVFSETGTTVVDLFFIDAKTGYFNIENGTTTFLKNTTDGGKNWGTTTVPAPGKIYYTDPSTQILSTFGHHGGVFKSTDGGLSFSQKTHSHGHSVGDFFFVDSKQGYLTGWFPGYLVKTNDGGETWMHLDPPKGEYLDVYFPTENTGYIAGLFGKVMKTTDKGETWTELNTGLSDQITLYSIACTNENTCYAVGDKGTIIKTTDGGATWKIEKSGTLEKLNEISIKGNTCFVAGDAGVFLRRKIKP